MTQVIDKCPTISLNRLKLLVISHKKPGGEAIGGKVQILSRLESESDQVQDNVPK